MTAGYLYKAKKFLKGPIVPMTTPLREDGSVDYGGLADLTEFYVSNGIVTLIAAGSTGYCYALSEREHREVVKTVVESSGGRAFIIAGVSHSGTLLANRLADLSERAGADALLITPPYYEAGISTRGLFEHYRSVAESHSLGVIAYNRRAEMPIDLDFFKRCAGIENIIGVKEGAVDYNLARDLLIELGDRLVILGGGSMRYYLWLWLWGSPGYLTGIANLAPRIETQFYAYLQQGDIESARRIVIELEQPFFRIMSEYGWHASLHAALQLFGLPAGGLRLPLIAPPESHRAKMREEFRRLGLLH